MSTSPKVTSSSDQCTNSILQPLWELHSLPSTSPSTVEVQQQQHQQTVKNKRKRIKRCHGNRKIQRFRQKCRAKGMKPTTVSKQVQKRFNVVENQTTQLTTHNDNVNSNFVTVSNNKRKRDLTVNRVVRSTSEMSTIQASVKKQKITTTNTASTTSISVHNNDIYRCAPYLKTLSLILLQALRLKLDHPLKKKFEQIFVYKRLQLLDKQFSLELHLSLWQSYMNMGLQCQLWPNEVYTMFNINESHLCLQFTEKYINDIQYQLDQCNHTLATHDEIYLENLSLARLDQRLKEYINSQQKHFRHKIAWQLSRFKANVQEKELCTTLLADSKLAHDQIQDNQLKYWKELLMLEQRILAKVLPENFDQLQLFITSDLVSPIIADDSSSIKYQLKHLKILQEVKRVWLDIYLWIYISKIQEYDRQSQQEFIQLEQSLNHSTEITDILQSVQAYMNHRKSRLQEEIYLQMTYYHTTLVRRRQRSSLVKQMIGVSPEVILDVHHCHHDLNTLECEYLSRGGNYIRPNRTILCPFSEREKLVQKEHDEIMKKTVKHLSKTCPSLPLTSPLFKKFSQRLHACLTLRYMTPLAAMVEWLRVRHVATRYCVQTSVTSSME